MSKHLQMIFCIDRDYEKPYLMQQTSNTKEYMKTNHKEDEDNIIPSNH